MVELGEASRAVWTAVVVLIQSILLLVPSRAFSEGKQRDLVCNSGQVSEECKYAAERLK